MQSPFRLVRWLLWILGIFILLGLAQTNTKAAASEAVPVRPKIGLALGGGAAAGFAHIGVLLWLEEHHVPVDYVAGTSMGGLVGGCYAMGMPPEEIRTLIKGINWDQFFDPSPPYDDMDFRRKEDQRDYSMALEIGWRDGLRLPSGLPAYRVNLLLSRITLPYSLVRDFNQLAIPFRCVATDLRSSNAVVLSEGSLGEAMRATMAIPGVFTPVQRNKQLLVDGGILDNVPVGVAKQMGSDVTIAVNLAAAASEREVETIDSVLSDTINVVTGANSKKSCGQANIVLSPDLNGLGFTSWKECDRYVERGYQAAATQAEKFRPYEVDQRTWEEYLQKRSNRRQPQNLTPMALAVTGASPEHQVQIQRRLQTYVGQPVDTGNLEKDLTRIMGSGLYESLRYEYEFQDGIPVLAIRVVEKPYGPPFIDPGLSTNVDGFKAGHVAINPAVRITSFDLVGEDSELRTDIGVGTDPYLTIELYKPIFNHKWFIAPAAFLGQTNTSLYTDGVRLTDYQFINGGFQADLGYSFNQFAEVRVGYVVGTQNVAWKVGNALPSELDGTFRATRVKYTYHTGDDFMIPLRGFDWDLQTWWYDRAPGTTEAFGKVENSFHWTIPSGRHDAFSFLLANGFSLKSDLPLMQQFRLGGPFQLGTYNYGELSGNNYLLSHIGYLKRLGNLSIIGGPLYFGIWLEYGGVYSQWSDFQPTCDLTAGFLSPTVLGPIYFGASYGKGSNPFFNIMVGRVINF